jgi:NAD(P)-dependent dehydrogenase (short-subunit alcohol dehydrogenase family)
VRADRHSEFRLDLSDAANMESDFKSLFAEHGRFDAVVFAAGVCPIVPLGSLSAGDLAETMHVNCESFIMLVKAYAACGACENGGKVVAVSSVSANEGWAGGAAYCASKGALSAAVRALDAELAQKGIRVMAIEPGHVLTDMFRRGAGRMGVPESQVASPQAVAREILALIDAR